MTTKFQVGGIISLAAMLSERSYSDDKILYARRRRDELPGEWVAVHENSLVLILEIQEEKGLKDILSVKILVEGSGDVYWVNVFR